MEESGEESGAKAHVVVFMSLFDVHSGLLCKGHRHKTGWKGLSDAETALAQVQAQEANKQAWWGKGTTC